MKTDRELTSTNQLIKIIRGETSAFPVEMMRKGKSSITLPGEQDKKLKKHHRPVFVVILCMILFTFASVPYLSGKINDLTRARNTVAARQGELNSLMKPGVLWEHEMQKADSINSLCVLLTTQRPYVSNTIKEISHLIPQNCYINNLNISLQSGESSQPVGNISMRATLVDDPSFFPSGSTIFQLLHTIENSDLFSGVRMGDQEGAKLSNNNTINFQMEFSEP